MECQGQSSHKQKSNHRHGCMGQPEKAWVWKEARIPPAFETLVFYCLLSTHALARLLRVSWP